MWEGERSVARGAEAGAAPLADARPLRLAGGQAVLRAAPVRADTVAVSPDMSARRAFETVLSAYASAISENLRCVLTETDAEGAHQLRVTLRRLRTCLRIFKPIVRREQAERIGWVARYIGAIVGELRDADVVIDDMIRPALGAAAMPLAIESWRNEVRTKVRASLQAARASSFANDLLVLAENGEWRAKAKRKTAAGALLTTALDTVQAKAAARGERMLSLTALERHDLRKDLKTWRYTAELTAAHDEEAAAAAVAVRRLQSVLGELNDMHMFETLGERAGVEPEALTYWRRRLGDEHRRKLPTLIATANARWLELSANGRLPSAFSASA